MFFFFFSSRRRHTRYIGDWSSDVCSSDLVSAVETLIFRARRALREQLEEGITCHEAELAISKQLDGRLSRQDKGALRAHLRECKECAAFARSQRAQRGALKSLAAIPLPPSLAGDRKSVV